MFVRPAVMGTMRWLLVAALCLVPATALSQTQTHYVTLEWTAPGDDGTDGRATQYQMRYSTTDPGVDTVGWWSDDLISTAVTGLPYPSSAGSTDSVRIQGLSSGLTYYFVLRASDEVPNWSGYSNVTSAVPSTCTVPSQPPQSFDVTDDAGDALLTWSSTSDPSATSLQIHRGTGSTGALSLLTTLDASETSYRDTSVGSGTYRYQVRWASTCGDGPLTSPLAITFVPPVIPTGPEAGVQARPNPSSGPVSFVVTVPGSSSARVTLRVFDSTGRVTSVVSDASYPPGESTISWPRTSTSGDRVAPGYYELIGEIGTIRVRERLVLLP